MIEAWLMILDKVTGQKLIAPLGSTFGTICLGMEFILSSKRPEAPLGHQSYRLGFPGYARDNQLVFIAVKMEPRESDLETFVRRLEFASNVRDLEPNFKGPWMHVVLRPNQDGLLHI